jgi:hypothetical protein
VIALATIQHSDRAGASLRNATQAIAGSGGFAPNRNGDNGAALRGALPRGWYLRVTGED